MRGSMRTLASWLSWDESTSRRIRESDPSTRRLPDASNSDYNDLSTHATKTYRQLHESYPKDKFKNNDRYYQPYTDSTRKPEQSHAKATNKPTTTTWKPTQKRTNNQKATLETADQKASRHSHNLRICQTRRRLERSFVNWCIGIICNTLKHNGRCHSSLL
jgi:hypothetical protein